MTAGRKVRVLTLTDGLSPAGGAERLAVKMTLGLDPERFDRYLCATRRYDPPAFLDELREAGVRVLLLERSSRSELRPWARLVRLLREELEACMALAGCATLGDIGAATIRPTADLGSGTP